MESGGWLTEFKKTAELEEMIAEFVGSKYCVMLPNGTTTLMTALLANDIKPGDKVLVPDYTMLATATSVSTIGAKPVLCDVERKTMALDFKHFKNLNEQNIKAIMLVSINGRAPQHWSEIFDYGRENNIPIIEDAAQSLGSYFNTEGLGYHLGTLGTVGSFSFSMPKIISTGQGGCLVTDSKYLYNKIKLIKNFGREESGKDNYKYPGINLKYTDLQAVIGIEQMKKLPDRIKRKKEIFKLYEELLNKTKGLKIPTTILDYSTPWFVDVIVEDRDKLISYLNKREIETRPFYPSLHSTGFFKHKHTRFYVSSSLSKHGLWLPSSLTLSNEDIKMICGEIKKGLK